MKLEPKLKARGQVVYFIAASSPLTTRQLASWNPLTLPQLPTTMTFHALQGLRDRDIPALTGAGRGALDLWPRPLGWSLLLGPRL